MILCQVDRNKGFYQFNKKIVDALVTIPVTSCSSAINLFIPISEYMFVT